MNRFKIYRLGIRYPKVVVLGAILLTVLSVIGASKLRIENDLIALLPEKFESVQGLHDLRKYFGGLGFLVLSVESENPKSASAFADQFAIRIQELPSVQFVDHRRPTDFIKERQWLYFDKDDLEEMERRLDRSLVLQEKGVSPIFSSIMDFADEENRPDLKFTDIRKKYLGAGAFETKEITSTDSGQLIVFRVKPTVHQQDLDKSDQLLASIKSIEAKMREGGAYPNVTVEYAGDHVVASESVNYLARRMTWVSIGVITLLFLILFAYFRSAIGALLVAVPLLMGISWTAGLAYLVLGHLNILTGFAAGILAGLGSDYGIYLVKRYYQEREAGNDILVSCDLTFSRTGRASYAAMVTTVFAFLALLFSDFGMMQEFGLVGAVGLAMNYVAMMLFLPACLQLIYKKQKQRPVSSKLGAVRDAFHAVVARVFAPSHAAYVLIGVIVIVAASTLTIPKHVSIKFEDGRMDAIGPAPSKPQEPTLYEKASILYGGTLQPTALLTRGAAEESRVVNAFREMASLEQSVETPFKRVLGLSSFIPQNVEAKKEILERLATKFEKSRYPMSEQRKKLIESMTNSVEASPLSRDQIPKELSRMFISSVDEDVFAVYLFPHYGGGITGDWMNWYSNLVRGVRHDNQLNFLAVDNPFVATEFVRAIEEESPTILLLTLIMTFAILIWTVRPFSHAVIVFGHLAAGLIILSGAMWLFKMPLNTLNIGALPIILGTGIDSFIHFTLQCQESQNVRQAIRSKLPPVLVSDLTTMVGFGALLLIPSAGLRSLGWTILLGVLIMALLCAFVLPRSLALLSKEKLRLGSNSLATET